MNSKPPGTHRPLQIIKRDGTNVPYDRERITNAVFRALKATGATSLPLARKTARNVEDALAASYTGDMVPSVEDIQDVVESVLMENRLTEVARAYIIYRHQRAMERAARAYSFQVTDNVPYRKIYEVLRWNMEHDCDSVRGLNRIMAAGGFPDLVRAADRRYVEEVRSAASRLLQRLPDVRVVIIAGPSSSGKTTTTIKLSECLKKAGVGFRALNIDNYFFDLEQHPRDEFGDYDYETPQALDLKLINRHLVDLLDGRTVRMPYYDFKTGRRTLDATEMRLEKNELLLIDSLHGLYRDMTSSVPDTRKFRIYIETLGQVRSVDGDFMRWADNRLLRRMVRDKAFRNLQPLGTLTHWHYVRRSELKNIIPFIGQTDCIINSALPYELPVLRRRVFRYVSAAIRSYRDDPGRRDAYIRATRVHGFLKRLRHTPDEDAIPADSLLREFIGGSVYTY